MKAPVKLVASTSPHAASPSWSIPLARQLLRDLVPGYPLFGSGHLPARTAAARAHVAARLEHEIAAL